MKIILMVILAVLSVALAGFLGWQKLSQPEPIPVVVSQTQQTQDETANWKTYKSENSGVELKIAPLFEKVGYKIIEDTASSSQNIFGFGGCRVIIFKTKPIESFWGKVDKDEYQSMLIMQICPQKYCKLTKEAGNWKGADVCKVLREGRDETEKGDRLFARYLAENEEFFAYLEGGASNGDVSDAMGWGKENVKEAQNQMLSTFKFVK